MYFCRGWLSGTRVITLQYFDSRHCPCPHLVCLDVQSKFRVCSPKIGTISPWVLVHQRYYDLTAVMNNGYSLAFKPSDTVTDWVPKPHNVLAADEHYGTLKTLMHNSKVCYFLWVVYLYQSHLRYFLFLSSFLFHLSPCIQPSTSLPIHSIFFKSIPSITPLGRFLPISLLQNANHSAP